MLAKRDRLIFKLKIHIFGKLPFCSPYSFPLRVACRNLCSWDVCFVGICRPWIPWVTGPVLLIYKFTKLTRFPSMAGALCVYIMNMWMDGRVVTAYCSLFFSYNILHHFFLFCLLKWIALNTVQTIHTTKQAMGLSVIQFKHINVYKSVFQICDHNYQLTLIIIMF